VKVKSKFCVGNMYLLVGVEVSSGFLGTHISDLNESLRVLGGSSYISFKNIA
jgi:hypothetical protein